MSYLSKTMSRIVHIVFLFLIVAGSVSAQETEAGGKTSLKDQKYPRPLFRERYRIAVLTPMYLDSVDLEKDLTHIPKFALPGLDFYKGVEIAADTLNKLGQDIDIHVFDSKAAYQNVEYLLRYGKLDSMDLVIANASVGDLKLLADWGKKNKINVVSAVSPSDAGQDANPYFTILQPRLVSHIEKIHKYVNAHHIEDNVFFINRKISAEQNALGYFKKDILNVLPGRFAEIELKSDTLDVKQFIKQIDTNYHVTIVLGILDANATYKVLKQLAPIAAEYHISVFCMPTTESVKALGKTDEFPDMPVFYTSAYYIDKITPASQYITREYRNRMGGHISDIVYKGFESVYFFSNLMKKFGVPFNEHLSDNAYTFITPYKIVPVKEKGLIKFFENKYMYLIRYENGIMTYE